MSSSDKEFYHGFAVAVGALVRYYDQPCMAREIMNLNGISMAMLEESGADDFDLDPIRDAIKAGLA